MTKDINNDILSVQEIKKYANNFICEVIVLETVNSTNTYAKEILSALNGSPAIVTARHQSAGRGRLGRSFFSPKDTGIYMSIVLKPSVSPATVITSAAAVAVCQVCEQLTGTMPKIKWVNDIFLNNKKICGILTEGIFNAKGSLDTAIVGIGINFNTTAFPDDIKDIAGSLMPQNVSKERIIGSVADRLHSLLQKGNTVIMEEYKKRLMVLGKTVSYELSGVTKSGVAIDINEVGNLIVETATGIDTLSCGEISLKKDFL